MPTENSTNYSTANKKAEFFTANNAQNFMIVINKFKKFSSDYIRSILMMDKVEFR